MRFCNPHWADLRTTIDGIGLGALVSDTGEEAMWSMIDEAQSGSSIDNFDPLMRAYNAIVSNVLTRCQQAGDPDLARQLIARPWCPLCLCNLMTSGNRADRITIEQIDAGLANEAVAVTGDFDQWIGYAAADQLTAWQELRP
jgi:hypothetical protein